MIERTKQERDTTKTLSTPASAAGTERFELDISESIQPRRQHELTPRFEKSLTTIKPSEISHIHAAELEGWTLQRTLSRSPAELAGDETFLACRPQPQPQPEPRPTAQLSVQPNAANPNLGPNPNPRLGQKPPSKYPHYHTAGTVCCEKILCTPEEMGQHHRPHPPLVRLPSPLAFSPQPPSKGAPAVAVMSPRPKSAVDFDTILATVSHETLLGWEKRQSGKVRGQRYKDRFDSGN